MREPAVGRRAVPVLYAGRDIHHIAGVQFLRRLPPLLIIAAARHADQYLSAAIFRVMNVPVVAAARLEGHVEHLNLLRGNWREVAFADEILAEAVIGRADGENHGVLVRLPRRIRVRLHPDLLGQPERRPRLGPARVERRMSQNLGDFAAGDAVGLRHFQRVTEGNVRQPLRHQRGHSDQRTVAGGQLVLSAPDLAEEHVIVQLRKFRSEFAQIGSACRLLLHQKGSFQTQW